MDKDQMEQQNYEQARLGNMERQTKHIYQHLLELGKFDLMDLIAKADKHEVHAIRIKRQLVPSLPYHNAIIQRLKKNGVEIIEQ